MPKPYHSLSDLPETIPVFPLIGAILFPGWQLPLNIFEPRYLNMVDDAMASERLIGMIQPIGAQRLQPALSNVGCVGRITSYSETDDGRYMLTLSGVIRYHIGEELKIATPYRQVRANYEPYSQDLKEADLTNLPPRLRLETALQIYLDNNDFNADLSAVEDAPIETLIHALATGCPFRPIEKQALLEAPDLVARCDTLIKLLSMSPQSSNDENGPLQ